MGPRAQTPPPPSYKQSMSVPQGWGPPWARLHVVQHDWMSPVEAAGGPQRDMRWGSSGRRRPPRPTPAPPASRGSTGHALSRRSRGCSLKCADVSPLPRPSGSQTHDPRSRVPRRLLRIDAPSPHQTPKPPPPPGFCLIGGGGAGQGVPVAVTLAVPGDSQSGWG